jgi:CheY-like chemotaxis protein
MQTVLIIDDDPLMYELYELMISSIGFKAIVASSGEKGLKTLAATQPDLVLLDMMMPRMNGLEVLKKIKATPELSHIPIVMFSNLADNSATTEALNSGAVRCTLKSDFTGPKLRELINEVLEEDKTKHPKV